MMRLSRTWALPLVAAASVVATTLAAAGPAAAAGYHQSPPGSAKATIVLVHGAFGSPSSWSAEVPALQRDGYRVVNVDNPLRGVASDSAHLESILQTISGPIVLVGHSYAGMLISQAAADNSNVKGLVYVAAYIPMSGESAGKLTAMNPGSLLGGTNLITKDTPTGKDLSINPATFGKVYAGGLSPSAVATAAATQHPIAASALSDAATVDPPAATPKWEIVALEDNAIPTKTEFFMADRVHARVVTTHSGHDVPAAQPGVVVDTVLQAARSVD
jgi:pimeloyl-ACP methyl ester carboxylesterase